MKVLRITRSSLPKTQTSISRRLDMPTYSRMRLEIGGGLLLPLDLDRNGRSILWSRDSPFRRHLGRGRVASLGQGARHNDWTTTSNKQEYPRGWTLGRRARCCRLRTRLRYPQAIRLLAPSQESLFAISPDGHPNTLEISPSPVNLSGTPDFNPQEDGLGFIARKQSATLFNYTVDVDFKPEVEEEEAGVTVFLTQVQHIDLGIVNLPGCSNTTLVPHFRFRVEASGKPNITVPEEVVLPVPNAWRSDPVRLFASAVSDSEYVFGAAPISKPEEYVQIGSASGSIVSGGSGPFTGEYICFCFEFLRSLYLSFLLQAQSSEHMQRTMVERARHWRTSAYEDTPRLRRRYTMTKLYQPTESRKPSHVSQKASSCIV